MERGECVLVFSQPESFCRCLSFMGNRIVSGDFDGIVHFWEITFDQDNKCVLHHANHSDNPTSDEQGRGEELPQVGVSHWARGLHSDERLQNHIRIQVRHCHVLLFMNFNQNLIFEGINL